MSHNVRIDGVKITSLDALRAAVSELRQSGAKIALNEDQKTFRTYRGQDPSCDMALVIEGSDHDVGFKRNGDGSYTPVFDPFGGGVRRAIGAVCPVPGADYATSSIGRLVQLYGVCLMENEAAQKGYTSTRRSGENGTIQLAVSVS